MPDRADLYLYQGDDWAGLVSVYNSDGTPADISAYTAQAQIRTDVADVTPTVVVEIATSVSSPSVNLFIAHTDTEPLKGNFVWDLQLTKSTGEITTILAGKVKVTQEVTRE